ncbi:hypothetical protein [Paludibacterium paludis]|uniref:Uncharacterized protein n=1 Tax=Paludibacterium paludis TaxID=1225769 RepID=A0A918U753_9NEIS|nr:hypothetical protein [Paludibacterium paludis]GGY05805.1 hypothetical protein GCM10011289_05260 [Paludibacterium paludis]
MIINLTSEQKKILIALKCKDDGKNADAFDSALQGRIDIIHIDTLCGLINLEFMMEGIDEHFEPTQYGIELENLLDAINRPRLAG